LETPGRRGSVDLADQLPALRYTGSPVSRRDAGSIVVIELLEAAQTQIAAEPA
jgi:hypothetical protein